MCNPAAYTVGGAAVTMFGQLAAGNAARQSANQQAQMATDQAEQFRQEGLDRAGAIRRAAAKVRGSATAAYAASGVRVNEGSPQVVDQSIAADSAADAAAAILTGKRRGGAADQEAALMRRAGADSQRASYLKSFDTLLGSGAAYDRWVRKQHQAEFDAGRVY